MPVVTITNTRKAGRLIFLEGGGSAYIAPGKSAELDLTVEQIEAEKAAGLGIGGKNAKAVPEPEVETKTDKFDAMSENELREYLEAETGEKPHWKASVDTLREKASAL